MSVSSPSWVRRWRRITWCWLAALVVAGTAATSLTFSGVPQDDRGCYTDTATPSGAAALVWLLGVLLAVTGVVVARRLFASHPPDRRISRLVLVGLIGILVGPGILYVLSYNPCWA